MTHTTRDLERTIKNLRSMVDELKAGDLEFLFARRGDPQWTNGGHFIVKYYQGLISLMERLSVERAEQIEEKIRRRQERLRREEKNARRALGPGKSPPPNNPQESNPLPFDEVQKNGS